MCGRFRCRAWVKAAVANWMTAAGVTTGPIFRPINKAQRVGNSGFSPKVIWGVVKAGCSNCGLENVAPHDLRRTCARLCHESGGELEQIQFLLGPCERPNHSWPVRVRRVSGQPRRSLRGRRAQLNRFVSSSAAVTRY